MLSHLAVIMALLRDHLNALPKRQSASGASLDFSAAGRDFATRQPCQAYSRTRLAQVDQDVVRDLRERPGERSFQPMQQPCRSERCSKNRRELIPVEQAKYFDGVFCV